MFMSIYFGIFLIFIRLQCPHCALFQTNNLPETKLEIKIKQFIEVPLKVKHGAKVQKRFDICKYLIKKSK
jgi:hypothetical protein